MEVSWSMLPEEIGERVLSFLPVPALFRCRSVCKTWNEVVRKASFLQLCDLNGRNKSYLFVTHHLNLDEFDWLDGTYRVMTCFLDLDERRWYLIPVDNSLLAPTRENVPRLLAMNDGLICEISHLSGTSEKYVLVVFDPVANTRWELPADGRIFQGNNFPGLGPKPPIVVTAVDDYLYECRSFKVFLLDQNLVFMNKNSGFFVYESSTNAWRALENPPLELGHRAGRTPGRQLQESAVFFQGNLYATFWYYNSPSRILILSYNLQENLWREVYEVESKNPGNPQLVVSGNRLFLTTWVDAPRPENQGFPECVLNYSVLEITEILVDEDSSRSVVQLTNEDVEEICGVPQTDFSSGLPLCTFDISFGFPLNSDDDELLVLFSRSTGQVVSYDVWSGEVDALPAHPLLPLQQALLKREEDRKECEDEEVSSHFFATLMNLSVRNILSGGPVPSRSHA